MDDEGFLDDDGGGEEEAFGISISESQTRVAPPLRQPVVPHYTGGGGSSGGYRPVDFEMPALMTAS